MGVNINVFLIASLSPGVLIKMLIAEIVRRKLIRFKVIETYIKLLIEELIIRLLSVT